MPMTTIFDLARRQQGSNPIMNMFGSVALIATVLAAAGMFALIAFSVLQRTREIGIRMAIGATPRHVLLALLKPHAQDLVAGMTKGIFAGVMVLLFIRVLAFPVPYIELLSGFGLGVVFFSVVAAVAIVLPALRVLRVNPFSALRVE
jgi:ABC-type antimicrobial peptide transport system permease subunit